MGICICIRGDAVIGQAAQSAAAAGGIGAKANMHQGTYRLIGRSRSYRSARTSCSVIGGKLGLCRHAERGQENCYNELKRE